MGRPRLLDIKVGDVFDDLECIEIIKNKENFKYKMRCVKCGRTKEMLSSTIRLKHGTAHKACGKGLKTQNKVFYERWQSMRSRTNNPNSPHYDVYGGRGINSDAFEYFIDFYDTMYESFVEKANEIGENNTSLDRIDCNGNYCPENCRWIYKNDQQKNVRKILKFEVTFPDGHTEIRENSTEFAKENGLDPESVRLCIKGKYSQHKGFKFRQLD